MDHPLADEPFAYRSRADGTVVISHRGTDVTALRGDAATRFATRVATTDSAGAQALMARATGNFKRGNERIGKHRGR